MNTRETRSDPVCLPCRPCEWDGGGGLGMIWSMAADDRGRILIGFAPNQGLNCHSVVRLHPNGALDDTFADAGDSARASDIKRGPGVSAIAVAPDGGIFLGGEFDLLEGTNLRGAMRLHGGVSRFEFAGVARGVDGSVRLEFDMPRGQGYRLQVSEDLLKWQPIPGDPLLIEETGLTDPVGAVRPHRFYRALLQP